MDNAKTNGSDNELKQESVEFGLRESKKSLDEVSDEIDDLRNRTDSVIKYNLLIFSILIATFSSGFLDQGLNRVVPAAGVILIGSVVSLDGAAATALLP